MPRREDETTPVPPSAVELARHRLSTSHRDGDLVTLSPGHCCSRAPATKSSLACAARGGCARPLVLELETARRYLDIMAIRFGDRLTISIDVPAEVDRALVPRLVLQPLLENALHHGIAARAGAGKVEVIARLIGEVVSSHVDRNGQPQETVSTCTDTWIREGTGWRVLTSHLSHSPARAPAPR